MLAVSIPVSGNMERHSDHRTCHWFLDAVVPNSIKTEKPAGVYRQSWMCIVFKYPDGVLYGDEFQASSDRKCVYAVLVKWKFIFAGNLFLYGDLIVCVQKQETGEELVVKAKDA